VNVRKAVVAIGGNSLQRAGGRGGVEDERRQLRATCEGLASVLEAGFEVVVTHGNGPQVGDALLRSELAAGQLAPLPLDVCVAETQGSIGYLIQQTLRETLARHGLRRPLATVVTQVLVSARDCALLRATKPIGPFFTREEAERRAAELGWNIAEDAGRGYRRVVPSPDPKAIIELETIRQALDAGMLVIACGGGGIPVIYRGDVLTGLEAVIDKDRASALLAWELEAELFLISTSVSHVELNYGTAESRPLARMTLSEARRYLDEGHFAAGSMGPKIEAAIQYLERTDGTVLITSPERISEALQGMNGTCISQTAESALDRLSRRVA
jgi:carbamate kinase